MRYGDVHGASVADHGVARKVNGLTVMHSANAC